MNAVLRTKFTPYSLLTAAFSIPLFFLSGKRLHTKTDPCRAQGTQRSDGNSDTFSVSGDDRFPPSAPTA